MKKIIVSGATSFIGIHLINALIEEGKEVTAIVRKKSTNLSKIPLSDKIKIIELNMDEYKDIHKYIQKTECFIHLAWDGTRGTQRDNFKLQYQNYENSLQALNSVAKIGCKLVLSAGSQAEYGNYNHLINEDTPCRPQTQYGICKLNFYDSAYEFCNCNGIAFKEPRFFSIYGSGDYEGSMIMSVLKNMLNNADCSLTQCIQYWDFLNIRDAVEGLLTLIETECDDGAYNFGSGDLRLLKSYIEEMYFITKSKSKLMYGQIPYGEKGMLSIMPDITKLKGLGWYPKVTFANGISEIIRDWTWYK